MITIDMEKLYEGNAKLSFLEDYKEAALKAAGKGNEVVLTGRGPVWLYLAIAHTLHGSVRKLCYDSPVTGPVVIFDHNPF